MKLLLMIGLPLFSLLPAVAAGQELTQDELIQLFNNQRDAFRSATASENGQTRGLTLVTVEAEAAIGSQASAATETTVAAATETVPDNAAKSIVFGQLDPEYQVNIRVVFALDSAALANDQKPKLTQLCSVMKNSDINLFRIVGHTDASGSDAYNQRLSLLRAKEVERYFVSDCGLAAARLEAVGMGEKFPYDQSNPLNGENRRVEFQALS